jgi:hypothetical protein
MVELRLRRAMPLRRAPTSSPFGALRINPNSQFVVVLGGRKSSSLPEQMKTKLEKQDRAGRRCPGARPTTGRRLRPVRRSCRWGYCQLSADTVASTIGLGCSQTFPSRSSTRHCAGRELAHRPACSAQGRAARRGARRRACFALMLSLSRCLMCSKASPVVQQRIRLLAPRRGEATGTFVTPLQDTGLGTLRRFNQRVRFRPCFDLSDIGAGFLIAEVQSPLPDPVSTF